MKKIFESIKNQKNPEIIKKYDLLKLISVQAGASTPTINTYIRFFKNYELMSYKKNSDNEYKINWDNVNKLQKEQ